MERNNYQKGQMYISDRISNVKRCSSLKQVCLSNITFKRKSYFKQNSVDVAFPTLTFS